MLYCVILFIFIFIYIYDIHIEGSHKIFLLSCFQPFRKQVLVFQKISKAHLGFWVPFVLENIY